MGPRPRGVGLPGIAIAAVFAASPDILSDSAQVYTSVAFFSWIIGVGFLVLALLRGVIIPLRRDEGVAGLSGLFPIVLAVVFAPSPLMPQSLPRTGTRAVGAEIV